MSISCKRYGRIIGPFGETQFILVPSVKSNVTFLYPCSSLGIFYLWADTSLTIYRHVFFKCYVYHIFEMRPTWWPSVCKWLGDLSIHALPTQHILATSIAYAILDMAVYIISGCSSHMKTNHKQNLHIHVRVSAWADISVLHIFSVCSNWLQQ